MHLTTESDHTEIEFSFVSFLIIILIFDRLLLENIYMSKLIITENYFKSHVMKSIPEKM